MSPARSVATLTLAGAIPGAVGGLVVWAAKSNASVGRCIAYGLWFAAAALFVAMTLATRKWLWRRTTLAVPEGWVFVTAAVLLTALGAAVDAAWD